ncbi:hypothetical protein ACFFHA_12425, partial [Halomonas alkalicola]
MFRKTLLVSAMAAAMVASAAHADTLRWTRSADGLTLDPHSQNEGPTHALNHQIFDVLIYQPALFTRALIERSEGTGCWHCLSGFASSARVAV